MLYANPLQISLYQAQFHKNLQLICKKNLRFIPRFIYFYPENLNHLYFVLS